MDLLGEALVRVGRGDGSGGGGGGGWLVQSGGG